MNLYIPLNHLNIFLQNLKEFPKYDDYKLDGERFGKQKIVFNKIQDKSQFFDYIFPLLPNNCMFVFPDTIKSRHYTLTIGLIDIENLSYLKEIDAIPSILTKKDNQIRFNAWIHNSLLEKVRTDNLIDTFSSIKGEINEKPYFIFSSQYIDELLPLIATESNEYIIKSNEIYVNLSLQFFSRQYNELAVLFDKAEIVDKGDF